MIPKLIHLMWWQGLAKAPAYVRRNAKGWLATNPGWKVEVWDEDTVRESIVKPHYPGLQFYFDHLTGSTDNAVIIKKCDLARLLVIHHLGGAYLDSDLIPIRSLDSLLSQKIVYNRWIKGAKRLPEVPSEDQVDISSYEAIVSREHCLIDSVGRGVANGVLISRPGMPLWMQFISAQLPAASGRVLDFVGTWALTRFIRANIRDLKGKLLPLPPHYFLWEPRYFRSPRPDYTVSEHPALNEWGDKSKRRWWEA